MKVSSINKYLFKQLNYSHAKIDEPISNNKSVDKQALDISANYNVAFSGLFDFKDKNLIDATRAIFDIQMSPENQYLVEKDASFQLGSYILNLQGEKEKALIDSLRIGQELVFGREATSLAGMDEKVSRQHLKIRKRFDNSLVATDLNSKNGTVILKNINVPYPRDGQFTLQQNQKYLLPLNSVLDVNGRKIHLLEYRDTIAKMPLNGNHSIRILDQIPLQIEKYNDANNVIVSTASSAMQTSFLYLDATVYEDFSQIRDVAKIKPYTPTLIPSGSLINMADEVFLDTNDSELKELFKKKRRIMVGRNDDCDYKIDVFKNRVSNRHLVLEQSTKGLIATDLNSTNSTWVVPPQKLLPQEDFTNINIPTCLKKDVCTLLPAISQLSINDEYYINTDDYNVASLLEKRGKIVIGQDYDCDIIIGHLKRPVGKILSIEKTDKGLVATQLSDDVKTTISKRRAINPAAFNNMYNLNMKQGNIGDCTLISALYSLSLNPRGIQLLNNMVSQDYAGNYIVTFKDQEPIVVEPKDLNGQVNAKGEVKYSVNAMPEVRAIERAYARLIKNQGLSYFSSNKEMVTMFAVIDDGALLRTPIYRLTGKMPNTSYIHPNTNVESILEPIALSGGTNNHVVTCGTPSHGKYNKYVDPERRFIESHAYSVRNIDVNRKTIEIVNPHNTKYKYTISFEEFRKYFDSICDLEF